MSLSTATWRRFTQGERLARLKDISVAFVEPESCGNIGFLARTMKNFGLGRLILVGGCPPGDEGRILAMHARDVIEGAVTTTWEGLLKMGFDFYVGTTSRQGHDTNLPRVSVESGELGRSLAGVEGRVCLILGREGNGLSLGELERCDLVATIPTSPAYPALNVSHAAAILFYEIFRSLGQPGRARMRRASEKEKEVLLGYVDLLVESSGLPEHRKRLSKLVFKRLVNRAFISGRECHTLIGLMKVLGQPSGA